MANKKDPRVAGKEIANRLDDEAADIAALCAVYTEYHNKLHESMGDSGYEYEELKAIKEQLRYRIFKHVMMDNGYQRKDDGLGTIWVKE